MNLFPEEQTLLLVDGNSLATACYFALPPLSTSYGVPTNATKGFVDTVFKLLTHNPTHMVVMFDSANNKRKEKHPVYKANRSPIPESFYQQLPYIKSFLNMMHIPYVEKEGYEADDLLASFVLAFQEHMPIAVATRDKDLFRLCSFPSVYVIYTAMQSGIPATKIVDRTVVQSVMGVSPEQIAFFKALAGDPSDNIKGVPGIGKVTAAKLLQEYGDLNTIVKLAQEKKIKPARIGNLICDYQEDIDTAFDLVTFMTLNVTAPVEDFEIVPPDKVALNSFFDKLEFSRRL